MTFAAVARRAGCSQNYLYTTPQIRHEIEKHRSTRRNESRPRGSTEVNADQEAIVSALRHQMRIMQATHDSELKQLRNELAEARRIIEKLTAESI